MTLLPKDANGCPYLLLAPMEGVADRSFRRAIATIGGFDEAVTEFIRVPTNAHVPSLAKNYQANELAPVPLAAQLMGSIPELMAVMAQEIEKKGAERIDLNCGCPSNTVTGRGAGSSLLKEPNQLYTIAKAMVDAVAIPVTLKMRIGFEDTSLFRENLFAAQESGVRYITLHPRTKVDGYGPPARWEFIAEAKSLLRIPVVGNGDIVSVDHAIKMLAETKCDALMIGRGCVTNPFIFQHIRAHFSGVPFKETWDAMVAFLHQFGNEFSDEAPQRTKINKLKQLMGFLFKKNEKLITYRQTALTLQAEDFQTYLQQCLEFLHQGWL